MTRSPLALLMVLLPLTVSGQTIYKCIDANGGTVISNSRVEKNCKAITSPAENYVPAPKARAAAVSGAGNPSPAGFPRVQEDTQRARDNDRRAILDQELASEQRNLDLAKKELADQEMRGAGDRVATARDRVSRHERNILAIQKELANLR